MIEALKEKDETKGQEALKRHFMLINEILEERENRKYREHKRKEALPRSHISENPFRQKTWN